MNDQTRHRIDEVQSANHAKKYEADTEKMFAKWLIDCPVIYYLSKPIEKDEKIIQVKTPHFREGQSQPNKKRMVSTQPLESMIKIFSPIRVSL